MTWIISQLWIILFTRAMLASACHSLFVTSGNYSLGPLNDNFWLSGGPFSFNMQGKWRSTDDGTLVVSNQSYGTSGTDVVGYFQESKWILIAEGGVNMEAAFRTYPVDDIPVVVFIARFPEGLNGTKFDANKTMTGYPSFLVQDSGENLGYLSYGSFMFGDRSKKTGKWDSRANINDGLDGSGPLALFDKSGNAVVISPFDNFMSASMWLNKSILNYGIMGGVDSLPPGFEYRTIAYCSNTGIGDAFEGWGRLMRRVYNKTDDVTSYHQSQDLSLTHLGYWTDNGAYYYYNTDNGTNYEVTLLKAQQDWKARSIPYAYLQLDSWFYPKDELRAVITWDATEDIFPAGIRAFQQKLGLPLVAHNRYWSINTTYAKSNGGFFDFIIGNQLSLPNDQAFWNYLLGHGEFEWGLIVYEQDWLNVQLLGSEILYTDLYMGKLWLEQMATAAAQHALKIQYCMALSRHAYQSLEFPTVTQARVSNDYHEDPVQWKIGVVSHFADAMGIAPSKDTFWTTADQPGNPYGLKEPYPTLQTVVATLSRGPVGPGDKIGLTNTTTLLRCCDATGRILKPSRPARAIDDQIREMAFADRSGAIGEVWTTYSKHDNLLYGVILAANLTSDYVISPQTAGFLSQYAPNFTDSMIYNSDKVVGLFSTIDNYTIKAKDCVTNGEPFCLFYTSPVLEFESSKIVLLGDNTKWVPMSEDRVLHIWQSSSGMAVTLAGKPLEDVTFTFLNNGVYVLMKSTADGNGCATFTVISTNSSKKTYEELRFSSKFKPSAEGDEVSWTPTLPPGFDCRFNPPPITTPPQPATTTPPPQSTTTTGKPSRASRFSMESVLVTVIFAALSLFG